MMKEDDDDNDTSKSTAMVRYPCMPSLVALQQMRNRLHMAQLGKRLMKWTALATGRELRRIAAEINTEYEDFGHQVKQAFIMIARCRYFYPNLDNMVIQNTTKKSARLTVDVTTKSVAGCRFIVYTVNDNEIDPYEHLGIDKGGQTIDETKKCWIELIKKMINILNLRQSFVDIDFNNKAATKKMNVLGKMVIPRTTSSIAYILSELEELEREDFFRLKKVTKLKEKRRKKIDHVHEEVVPTCRVCMKMLADKKKEEDENREKCLTCLKPLEAADKEKATEEKLLAEKQKLEDLKIRLAELVELQKTIEENNILTESMEEYLITAEDVKNKLEERIRQEEEEKIILPPDVPLEKLCKTCRDKVVQGDLAIDHIPDEEQYEMVPVSDETPKVTINTQKMAQEVPLTHLFEHPQEELDIELGVFETEIKEITKVIRTRNEDGTITEQKKVLRMKKEIRAPKKPQKDERVAYNASEVSAKSANPYPDSKTIGRLEINKEIRLLDAMNATTSLEVSNKSITSLESDFNLAQVRNCDVDALENILDVKDEKRDRLEDLLRYFNSVPMTSKASSSTETEDEIRSNEIRKADSYTQYE